MGDQMAMKLICGIGLNDSHAKTSRNEGGRRVWCKFYDAWKSMLTRCYSAANNRRRPTYVGCSVDPEWLTFSVFRNWMGAQDWQGKQLDKDLLVPGNKIYSPDTCVFVSRELNQFLTDSGRSRGEWPIGVSLDKKSLKFKATCCNPITGKPEHLGLFIDPCEAHEAWRNRKHQHALRYADMQTDPRIAAALRTRFAPED